MNLQAPLRYKIENKYLWTKFGSQELWGKTIYVGTEKNFLPINQRFGNVLPTYTNAGYKGHMGTDWYARNYTCVYAPCDAVVTQVVDLDAIDPDSGTMGRIGLEFTQDNIRYKWIALHISDSFVRINDTVRANQLIGLTGNTGGPQVTTGSHLHSGLYLLDKSGNIINLGNGYGGGVDDFPYYGDGVYAVKTDELSRIFEYTKANGSQFDFYIGWNGGENFANVSKKLSISGVTRSQYYNYLVKKLFNA